MGILTGYPQAQGRPDNSAPKGQDLVREIGSCRSSRQRKNAGSANVRPRRPRPTPWCRFPNSFAVVVRSARALPCNASTTSTSRSERDALRVKSALQMTKQRVAAIQSRTRGARAEAPTPPPPARNVASLSHLCRNFDFRAANRLKYWKLSRICIRSDP